MPVYNGAKWLGESINSVLEQTFTDYELICINDSSTDESLLILDSFAKKDSRIKVFTKQNEGQGFALNYGVLQAKGKYLCFLDQDDKYDKYYLEKMLKSITDSKCKISLCNAYLWTNNKIERFPYPEYHGTEMVIDTIDKKLFFYGHYFPQWTKIIERDFFIKNHITFPHKINKASDVSVHYQLLFLCNKIGYIEDCIYYHRYHSEQISYNFNYPLYYYYSINDVIDWAKKYLSKKECRQVKYLLKPLLHLSIEASSCAFLLNDFSKLALKEYLFIGAYRILRKINKRKKFIKNKKYNCKFF